MSPWGTVLRRSAVLTAASAALFTGVVVGAQAAESNWTVTPACDLSTALAVSDSGVIAGYVGSWPSEQAALCDAEGTMTYLATPDGTTGSVAVGINNRRQVAGQIDVNGQAEAVVWQADGSMTRLGFLPGGSFSSGQDINDDGWVVGVANAGTHTVGFAWKGAGSMEALPMPQGMTDGVAQGINDTGQIVGSASAMYAEPVAVLWEDGVATTLSPLAEGAGASAVDINDLGQIVGNSATAAPPSQGRDAVLWSDGNVVDLGWGSGSFSLASGINDGGQIVGYTNASGMTRGFMWDAGAITPLEPLAGDTESYAIEVNATGEVVGDSVTSPVVGRAVVWRLQTDTAPPVITVPADLTVNATSPAGASVTFEATATDENPANPAVTCAPQSGSVFPIGDTTVECSATDAADNTATASFKVDVKGAAEQLVDLGKAVKGVGPGTSLADKVKTATNALSQNNVPGACSILRAFVNQVTALSGKGVPAGVATSLISDATRIRAVLGCAT